MMVLSEQWVLQGRTHGRQGRIGPMVSWCLNGKLDTRFWAQWMEVLLLPAHCYKAKWFIKLNKVHFSLFKNQPVLRYSGKTQKVIAPWDAGGCLNVAELTSCTSKSHIHNSSWPLFERLWESRLPDSSEFQALSRLWFYWAASLCQDDEDG